MREAVLLADEPGAPPACMRVLSGVAGTDLERLNLNTGGARAKPRGDQL